MTATQQVYTVTERTDGLPGFSAYAGDGLHWIASASPHTGNYAEPGSWFVMLGLDATGTIGCLRGWRSLLATRSTRDSGLTCWHGCTLPIPQTHRDVPCFVIKGWPNGDDETVCEFAAGG